MLSCLNDYCLSWGLTINYEKLKIMHFKPRSTKQTVSILRCENNEMELVKQYKYLGLIFTEFLDLLTMAKTVAKSASRAILRIMLSEECHLSATQDAMMLWKLLVNIYIYCTQIIVF